MPEQEQFPVFKKLNNNTHIITGIPSLHILPKTETVMYAITWMIEQQVWVRAYDTCIFGTYTIANSGVYDTHYMLPKLLKAWTILHEKNVLNNPNDELKQIENQLHTPFDTYNHYMVIASHLSANTIASIISAVDNESAIESWSSTPTKPELYLEELHQTEDYYEDYGWPCPYTLNHESGHFKGRTKRLLAIAKAIQTNSQIQYDAKGTYINVTK